ncbi:nif11-like leader peptide domain protein [Synechococcus sp. BIOS-E4-1]|nr:nif11-like leader peptide domain protein [Synechococcus sp. BIOS-E4-1]
MAIAKEAGLSISADDLKNAQSEVSEEELEGVGGGYVSAAFECCMKSAQSKW